MFKNCEFHLNGVSLIKTTTKKVQTDEPECSTINILYLNNSLLLSTLITNKYSVITSYFQLKLKVIKKNFVSNFRNEKNFFFVFRN